MTQTFRPRASGQRNLAPWRVPDALDPRTFLAIRRRLVLDCCKWDPQVGDVSTLAPFPLILKRQTWRRLASWSEALAAEALAAEAELVTRPDLHARLAIPRRLRRLLGESPRCPEAGRVIRFDFHWTTSGWRISEANADVPGGFTEASSFSELVAAHYPDATTAGNPADAWADALMNGAGAGGIIVLIAAPGYMEDQQIVAYLAQLLRRRGVEAHVCGMNHLRWDRGQASLACSWRHGPVNLIVRFYQGEWLSRLPRRTGWQNLFRGRTPVANPGSSLLIESKRFPLVWDDLKVPLPTWRQLLPRTCEPSAVSWRDGDQWVLKAAFCNTGDQVAIRRELPERQWRRLSRAIRWSSGWIAQERFEPIPVQTPNGAVFPCIGVYTVNGRAAGIYGRIAPRRVIDFAAIDVAVLVDKQEVGDDARGDLSDLGAGGGDLVAVGQAGPVRAHARLG